MPIERVSTFAAYQLLKPMVLLMSYMLLFSFVSVLLEAWRCAKFPTSRTAIIVAISIKGKEDENFRQKTKKIRRINEDEAIEVEEEEEVA